MVRESLLRAAWRTNRTFPLLIAGMLLLNVAVHLVMIFQVEPWVGAMEQRYFEQQEKLRHLRQGEAAIATPQSIFRQGQEDMATFRTAIPPAVQFPALVGELFSRAGETGLLIDRINYEPKEIAEKKLLRYGLVFSVTGSYGQIKRFIHSLEQSPRLLILEEISLGEHGAGEVGSSQVTLRIRLSTYFRAEAS